MTGRDLDTRWVVTAVAAFAVGVVLLLVARSLGSGASEVVSGLAWLAAIAGLVALVRSGFDGGVHDGERRRSRVR
jgi:hypothetical protein